MLIFFMQAILQLIKEKRKIINSFFVFTSISKTEQESVLVQLVDSQCDEFHP